MPVSAANVGLQNNLRAWADKQGIDKPLHDLSLGQMQKASRALDVPLADVLKVREELVGDAATATMNAGTATRKDRDMAKGSALGHGGGDATTSPLLIGHTWGAKPVDTGKGKGSTQSDSDLAMSALSSTRFVGKVKSGNPYTEFKGYRGGSDDIDLFFRSSYSASDAKQALEAFSFLGTMAEAKEYIGMKIDNGTENILADIGVTPHDFDNHECVDAFENSAYTMRDVRRAVAEFPFLTDLSEAKEYIGLKIVNGSEDILQDVGIGRPGFSRPDETDLFFKAGYTYDDAEAAMGAFDFLADIGEAKAYIGLKVQNGTEFIMREVGISPGNFDAHEMMGAFYASPYSADDAEAAMKAFDFLNSIPDAKEYIGLKVINGTEDFLADNGITRHSFDTHECNNAFRRSGYSEVDARAALMAFDFLDSVQGAKEYMGLKIVNGTEDILSDVGITRSEFDGHEQLAAYARGGYTNADCDKAVAGWDFLSDRNEAREYLGLKVMNGAEHILAEVGIVPRNANNMYDFKSDTGYWDKGSIGKGDDDYDFGAGDVGKGDFGKGDFGKGDFSKGDFSKGNFAYVNTWDYKK